MIRIHAHPCFGQKKTQSSALQQRAVALEIEITASALQQEVAPSVGWVMWENGGVTLEMERNKNGHA